MSMIFKSNSVKAFIFVCAVFASLVQIQFNQQSLQIIRKAKIQKSSAKKSHQNLNNELENIIHTVFNKSKKLKELTKTEHLSFIRKFQFNMSKSEPNNQMMISQQNNQRKDAKIHSKINENKLHTNSSSSKTLPKNKILKALKVSSKKRSQDMIDQNNTQVALNNNNWLPDQPTSNQSALGKNKQAAASNKLQSKQQNKTKTKPDYSSIMKLLKKVTKKHNKQAIAKKKLHQQQLYAINTRTIIFYVIAGIAGGMVIWAGVYILYYYSKKSSNINKYAMDPQQYMYHQQLDITTNQRFEAFFTPDVTGPNNYNQQSQQVKLQIKRENKENVLRAQFNQEEGKLSLKSFLPVKTPMKSGVKFIPESVYYEIELENYKKAGTDLVIGFFYCSAQESDIFNKQHKNDLVGDYENSIGFHGGTGTVTINGIQKFSFDDLECQYGDTIGMGYRFKDGRVWLTFNGKLLNPVPLEESNKSAQESKVSTLNQDFLKLIGFADDKLVDLEREYAPLEKQKMEQDNQIRKEHVVIFQQPKNQPNAKLYAVISANSQCIVKINVGNQPFLLFTQGLNDQISGLI